jgi:hypothetical protein
MRTICLQFQPKLVPGIAVNAISKLMLRLSLSPEIRGFSIQRGRKHSWVNFLFNSQAVGRTWKTVQSRALAHHKWGPRLRRSSIVTCEGSRGWDNYLLLHHFNTQQGLDKLDGV